MEPIEERFEQAKKLRPAHCLWAWTYSGGPTRALGGVTLAAPRPNAVPTPVSTVLGVGGWTFCGRHTIRALTLNEARDIERAGIEWHHYESEPTDALPATEEYAALKEARVNPPDDGIFKLSHVAMYGRAKSVGCQTCLVSLDKAQELGHVTETMRLGEAVLRIERGVPNASWWKHSLYSPR